MPHHTNAADVPPPWPTATEAHQLWQARHIRRREAAASAAEPQAYPPEPQAVEPQAVDPQAVQPQAVEPHALEPQAVHPPASSSWHVGAARFLLDGSESASEAATSSSMPQPQGETQYPQPQGVTQYYQLNTSSSISSSWVIGTATTMSSD